MRKKIVAGNWKMNCTKEEAIQLAQSLHSTNEAAEVKVFVPALHLSNVQENIASEIAVGAQNLYPQASGAFTGEISPTQIKSYGSQWVLVGHSERRSLFHESNEFLKEKVDAALSNELQVMFCFGETLTERESGNAEAVVLKQLQESVFHLSADQFKNIVLAYEPVWAIGTGVAATPDQAQDMHAFIRQQVSEKYGSEAADNCSILYGGSVKPNNAVEIFGKPDIDGGLIGGASLKADSFTAIIDAV